MVLKEVPSYLNGLKDNSERKATPEGILVDCMYGTYKRNNGMTTRSTGVGSNLGPVRPQQMTPRI